MQSQVKPLTIPAEAKERLRIMFIAKHAKWEGGLHPEDGNHALYHVEVREILKGLGLNLVLDGVEVRRSDARVVCTVHLKRLGESFSAEVTELDTPQGRARAAARSWRP